MKTQDTFLLSPREQSCILHYFTEVLTAVWFHKIVVRLHMKRVHRVGIISCKEDHNKLRMEFPEFSSQQNTVHSRKLDIQEGSFDLLLLHILQRLLRVMESSYYIHPRKLLTFHFKLSDR